MANQKRKFRASMADADRQPGQIGFDIPLFLPVC
jgi:hypothetical protein